MVGKTEIFGLEDYWVVVLDGSIVNSFDTEEEAVAWCDDLESSR